MLTFTTTGSRLTDNRQADLAQIFAKGTVFGFSTRDIIRTVIDTLQSCAMTHFADSPSLAPFGLVDIRRIAFKGGPVNIYLADTGSQTIVLATERIETAGAAKLAA